MTDETTETVPRIGVFICDCGGKIANVLDTETLRQEAAALPEVVYAAREAYPCSKDGQERIRRAITDQKLDRVLIAGCSPRLVEKLFRETVQPAGLEAGYLNVANLREQVAYVHPGDPLALPKAAGLIEMGVARLATTHAVPPHSGRVVKSALVVGDGLGALTVALGLAESGIRVTLIEQSRALGSTVPDLQEHTRQLTDEKSEQVLKHPMIETLLNACVTEVTGHPGDYEVRIRSGEQSATYTVGAIVMDNGAQPKPLGAARWYDRDRVKTQVEFETELDESAKTGVGFKPKEVVIIFCAEESQREHCSRVCCNIGIRQAMRAKQLNPNANVTVLFRELYLGGVGEAHEAELVQASKLGVTFFRYRREHPPVIGDKTVDVYDTLTGEAIRLPFDQIVLTMPLIPLDNSTALASLLGLPQDEAGFLAEPRVRLLPGHYTEPGIYVLGSAQQPADTSETLFQAYLTSVRAQRFLSQDTITMETAVVSINPELCTGCGSCPQVCPSLAIRLKKRDSVLSLATVDELRCIGCGNCVVVCPVKAVTLPGWDDVEILAQISAALHTRQNGGPIILALACEWSAYGAADMAGARHIPYLANVRILRMNCSARFDPYHILWAFLNGADGVFLGACSPGECHYGMGNLYAKVRVEKLRAELKAHGVDPRRIRLEYLRVDDGKKFAYSITDFVKEIQTEVANKQG